MWVALYRRPRPAGHAETVLKTAREVTGARYAALGILNDEHSELEQFLSLGVDGATHRAIGDLPRGRGVLGALIAAAGAVASR